MDLAQILANYAASQRGTAAGAAPAQNPSLLRDLAPALIGAAGAGISAYGASKSAQSAQAQTAKQFEAEMAQRQLESERNYQLQQATSAASANPLGAYQQFAQKQALAKALLGGARNVSFTPGDSGIAQAMGSFAGGMRLPEEGLDPKMLERLYGDAATQSSIAQRQKEIGQINPNQPVYDLANLFGASANGSQNAFTTDVQTANKTEADKQLDQSAQQRALVQQAMAEDAQTGKPGGSSIWKKIGKIGAIAGAGIATAMTGGAASPLLMAAIGAGTGAATGALSGGGWKGALLGAGLGAATGGIGGGSGGTVAKQALGQALKTTGTSMAKNPTTYTTLLGR